MGKYDIEIHKNSLWIEPFAWKASDVIGRKKSLIAVAIPQLISWIMILLARKSIYILLARFLSGLSGGALYVIIPLFTSEIADDRWAEQQTCLLYS